MSQRVALGGQNQGLPKLPPFHVPGQLLSPSLVAPGVPGHPLALMSVDEAHAQGMPCLPRARYRKGHAAQNGQRDR